MRPTTITLRGFFTGLCAGVILFGALAFGVTAQVSKPVSTPDIQRVIPQSGSRGQYLTIQGSALGVIQGTVSFVRAGQEVPADIQMPAVCQRIWWRDSSIVFKVPQSAKTGANTIKIKNSEGTLLKEVAFTVTDGVAPPGICGIVPDNGPAGVPVHVYGERFGSTPGRVSFGATTLTIPESQWHSDDITTTVPQFGGTTTAVRVITADQTLTNPGSYALGQCRPNQCGEGSSCCADGSCRPTGLCAEKQTAMCSYSWSFFTGKLKRQGESCVKSNECLSGACGKDGKCAAGVKVAGEMCVFDGECAGGAVCLNGRCATSLRKIGDACKGSNECSSQMCKDGICAAGSKNIGEQCVQKEECATQNCVNGQCAQSIRCLKVEKIEPQGKNIRENSVFSVTFNQLVSHESVTSNFGLNPKVAGTYEFETIGSGNDAKTKALFKPSNYLSRQKLYAVSIGKNIQSASSANTIGACVNDSGAVCVGAGQICTAPGATCTSGAKCTGPNSVCSGTGSTCTGTNAKCVDGADCAQKNRSIQQGCFLTKVSDASFASSVAIDEPWHWSISALAAVIKNSSHHVWHQAQLAFSSFFHSSIPDVLAADAPLPNPTNLEAKPAENNTIILTWAYPANVSIAGFEIYRKKEGQADYAIIKADVASSLRTYTDTSLEVGKRYDYQVYAFRYAGPTPTPRCGDGTIDIGEQCDDGDTINDNACANDCKLKGEDATVTHEKPSAPGNLSATGVTSSTIELSWTDTSTNELNFVIERSLDGSNYTLLTSPGYDTTTFVDTGLSANTNYWYRVYAANDIGQSAASNVVNQKTSLFSICLKGKPLAPTSVSTEKVTNSNDISVKLSWVDTSNNEDGFLIQRAVDGGQAAELYRTANDITEYHDSSVEAGHSYSYTIASFDCAGASAAPASSITISGSSPQDESCAAGYTLCGTPPNQICYIGTTCPSQPGPSQCDNDTTCEAGEGCTCNDCNGKQDSCTASLVCRADGGDVCALASCGDGKKDTGESCDDGNSNNADSCRNDCSLQTCGNRVIDAGEQCDDGRNGNDEDGCTNLCQHSSTGGGGGGLDNKDQQQEQIIKPSKPTGVRLDVVSDTQINVFWNDTTTEQRYFIERSSDGTAFSRVATAGMNTTQYADTGLSRFTRYWYRIIAANSAGDSNPSDSVDARTNLFSFCFTGVPTAPTNFSAESIAGTANIVLRWTDTAQNERAVDIQRSSNNQDFATIYRLPANTGTYLDSNINPQTQYWYRVGMTNCKGESVFSNISSATSGTSGGSLPPGAQCTANNQCSSNICQNGVCTSGGGGSGDTGGTTPPGGSCTTNNQCASSICQNGICKGKNVGDACTIANECSSGLCTNGVCTSGGGGSGDTGGTTPPGGSCTTNNQCTTNLCFNGKCDDDKDKDGLPDSVDPNSNNPDTDGDGLLDGQEDKNKNGRVDQGETDPTNPDTDHDGLLDGQEDKNKNGIKDPNETDPLNPDTDGDGVLDGADPYPLDPTKPGTGAKDSDGDGLSDDLEKKTGTNPNKADTDGDGLLDGQEDKNKNGKVDKGETNPKKADSDGNGIKDGDQCSVIKTAYSRSPLADLDGATYYRESSIVFHMAAIQQPSGRIRSGAADANATISGGGDGTTLNAPTNVLASDASSISSAKISLSWNDSNTEATFTIQRSTDQTTWSLLVAGHTAKTYDDTSSLERGRTYWYRVRAVKGDVTSDWATTPEGVMPPTQPGERYTIAGINIRKAGAGNITFDLFECVGDTCQYDVQQTTQFPGNQHGYTLTAYALNSSGAEVLVTDPVVWESAVLSTQSSGADAQAEINRITGSPHLFTITARKNGSAVATITATAGGVSVSKQLAIEVRVCDNPWRIGTQTGYDNLDYDFSLSYCRGNGSTNLLPTLGGAIPVGTRSEYPHFERELFFPVSGSSDVIVVAFARSPKYFSPSLWYQYTIGGGFSVRDPINGYPTIQDSTGTYVMAFDTTDDGGKGATVYYFTTNTGASQTTQHILGELLSGVQFSSHGFSYDAVNTDGRGMKLRRDFTRLLHFEYLTSLLDRYAAQKRSYPKLESGTYRKNETISGWPSWKNELARSLGVASASFPDDPYPKAGNFCETDATCVAQCSVANYDKATCWNATAKLFGITTAGGKTAVETAVNTERVHAYSYHYTTATNSYKACARFEVLKASTTGNLYVGCVTGAVSAAGVVSSSGASTAGGGSTTGGFGTLFGQLFFTLPPEILITVPTSGQAFQRNWEPEQRVTFHGSASDPEGLPLTVGNTLDGTDPQTTNIDINKLSSGNHTYTFFARNSARASSTLSRTFTVTQQADNHQPSASVSAPTTIVRQSANTGELMFTVNASDPDSGDGISRVDYSFGSLSGTLTAAPYTKTLSLSSFSDNTYTLTITVYDQRYGVRYSDTVGRKQITQQIRLRTNTAPTFYNTMPDNNLTYYTDTGSTVTIRGLADDTIDGIATVKLYRVGQSSPLRTVTDHNYSFLLENLPVGQYQYRVVAADTLGMEAEYTLSFTVASPPLPNAACELIEFPSTVRKESSNSQLVIRFKNTGSRPWILDPDDRPRYVVQDMQPAPNGYTYWWGQSQLFPSELNNNPDGRIIPPGGVINAVLYGVWIGAPAGTHTMKWQMHYRNSPFGEQCTKQVVVKQDKPDIVIGAPSANEYVSKFSNAVQVLATVSHDVPDVEWIAGYVDKGLSSQINLGATTSIAASSNNYSRSFDATTLALGQHRLTIESKYKNIGVIGQKSITFEVRYPINTFTFSRKVSGSWQNISGTSVSVAQTPTNTPQILSIGVLPTYNLPLLVPQVSTTFDSTPTATQDIDINSILAGTHTFTYLADYGNNATPLCTNPKTQCFTLTVAITLPPGADQSPDTTSPNGFKSQTKSIIWSGGTATFSEFTVLGINVPASISVVGGEYSKNGGAWTTSAGIVRNSDKVTVRVSGIGTCGRFPRTATVTIGATSATFVGKSSAPASRCKSSGAPLGFFQEYLHYFMNLLYS